MLGVGAVIRPVAMPDDVDDPSMLKASGRVVLPQHISWSPPFDFEYDVDDPTHRRSVYALVLSEGSPEDVRYYIDVHHLVEMWDRIKLPSHVRPLWEEWLTERGYLPGC